MYVTVIFPPLTSILLTTSDLFSNAVPFLEVNLASVFVLEYSILICSLIFWISAAVKLLISATPILSPFNSGCWMLYLYVWDLTTNLKNPGWFEPLEAALTLPPAASATTKYLSPKTEFWSSRLFVFARPKNFSLVLPVIFIVTGPAVSVTVCV